MADFGKSVANTGWYSLIFTLLAGILGCFGLAKSGFGTECVLVAAESASSMKNDNSRFARMGVPKIPRTPMRSYMRIGMGYLNTWAGFIGFAVGYLPFTLFLTRTS